MEEGAGEVGPEEVDPETEGGEEVEDETVVFVGRYLGCGARDGIVVEGACFVVAGVGCGWPRWAEEGC